MWSSVPPQFQQGLLYEHQSTGSANFECLLCRTIEYILGSHVAVVAGLTVGLQVQTIL